MRAVRRRPLAGILVAGAASLLVAAGCGGDSGGLTADEYREQADAICADANRTLDALPDPQTAEEAASVIDQALPTQRSQFQKIEDLDPPDDLQQAHDDAVELLRQQLDAIEGAKERIDAGEDATAVLTEVGPQVERLNEQADAKAKELGLTICGSDDAESDGTDTTTSGDTSTDTGGDTSTDTGGATAEVGDYLDDVQSAARSLQAFGSNLQSISSVDDLRSKATRLQGQLDNFDEAIGRLDGYTLDDPQLEEQRAGLAETGPKVTDVLRRFLDAAQGGDLSAVQSLVPEVISTISEFQAAAQVSP